MSLRVSSRSALKIPTPQTSLSSGTGQTIDSSPSARSEKFRRPCSQMIPSAASVRYLGPTLRIIRLYGLDLVSISRMNSSVISATRFLRFSAAGGPSFTYQRSSSRGADRRPERRAPWRAPSSSSARGWGRPRRSPARRGAEVGRGSQPQRRPGGLHGLVDDGQQLGGQGVQVDLLAEAAAEGGDGLGGVVAAAVEACG